MNNKKLLIASSSRSEAITKWIINNHSSNNMIDLIFIDDLLNKYQIHDELNDEEINIKWYENNTLKYTNATHSLLNRIVHLDKALFNNFKFQDREYAKREFESYLGFALNGFRKAQKIAINGVCEHIYSLPQQWKLVSQRLSLPVPKYYWGSKDYEPFKHDSNIIHSGIYNFLNWSPLSVNNENTSSFCFKRPIGEPLFIASVGSSHLITTNLQVTDAQLTFLGIFLNKVRSLFNYFIFEVLVFINEEQLTFGCINIDVIHSQYNPLFDDFLNKNLLQEYNKCLN